MEGGERVFMERGRECSWREGESVHGGRERVCIIVTHTFSAVPSIFKSGGCFQIHNDSTERSL